MVSTLTSPKALFTFDRLDLIIKYKFIEMVHRNIRDPFIEKLYDKHISMRVGKKINQGIYPDKKKSVKKYAPSFISLYNKIKNDGYDGNCIIQTYKRNGCINLHGGAHRTSICRLLDIKIPTTNCILENQPRDWGMRELSKNLNEDEINFTLYNYFHLNDNVRVFVIFPPAIQYVDQIKKKIGERYSIKHELELKLNKDWQLKNLLRESYSYSHGTHFFEKNKCPILKKYNILKKSEPSSRYNFLILFAEYDTACDRSQDIKREIRKDLNKFINEKDFITVHASDSIDEKNSLLDVFLNRNTLSHIKTTNYESKLVDSLLEDYVRVLKKYNIKDSLVVGSTPLDLFNLRDTTDIDFCLSEQERKEKKFNQSSRKLSDTTDIVTQKPNYCRSNISDYALITNPMYHFQYRGYKFASLKIMHEVKSRINREKDKKDCLLIENFIKKHH